MPPYWIGLAAARGRACSTVPRFSRIARGMQCQKGTYRHSCMEHLRPSRGGDTRLCIPVPHGISCWMRFSYTLLRLQPNA
jgi:hypothetical protein